MTKIFVIEGDARTWEEALQKTADVLLKNDCVVDDFYDSCVEREKVYPTGLTEQCPVALPHTNKEHVKTQAICALRLKDPVKFYSMEDNEKTVDVNVVLNLAFLDDSEHIKIVSRIIRSLKNVEFVNNLTESTIEDFEKMIRNNFLEE